MHQIFVQPAAGDVSLRVIPFQRIPVLRNPQSVAEFHILNRILVDYYLHLRIRQVGIVSVHVIGLHESRKV